MRAVKSLSQFRWRVIGRWRGGGGLVSSILVHQLEGYVKEPVTLFEKSRGRRPRCHALSDLCRHRSGWARCDQKYGLKWLQECAFTCWRPISPLWFLRNSAIGCKWGKMAQHIFFNRRSPNFIIMSTRKNEQQRKIFISYSKVTKSNNLRTETSKSVAIIHYFITIAHSMP